MVDVSLDRAIKDDAEDLVAQLARRWSEKTLKPVHADMQYGQFSEAVLNIISISHKQHLTLTSEEAKAVIDLIHKMELQDEIVDLTHYLTALPHEQRVYSDERVLALLR